MDKEDRDPNGSELRKRLREVPGLSRDEIKLAINYVNWSINPRDHEQPDWENMNVDAMRVANEFITELRKEASRYHRRRPKKK